MSRLASWAPGVPSGVWCFTPQRMLDFFWQVKHRSSKQSEHSSSEPLLLKFETKKLVAKYWRTHERVDEALRGRVSSRRDEKTRILRDQISKICVFMFHSRRLPGGIQSADDLLSRKFASASVAVAVSCGLRVGALTLEW